MDQPSTAGLYDIVVGDDLRDVGVPILLFTAASLTDPEADSDVDDGSPDSRPTDDVTRAAAEIGLDLDRLDLFGTDGYRLQRALGQQLLDRP